MGLASTHPREILDSLMLAAFEDPTGARLHAELFALNLTPENPAPEWRAAHRKTFGGMAWRRGPDVTEALDRAVRNARVVTRFHDERLREWLEDVTVVLATSL